MQIQSVEIENILSIGKASISFEETGLCLVEGWNFDAERSNGAGKSAIFNCISFALYDKIPRKVTASEILKRESNKGHVAVKFIALGDEWLVVRRRPKQVQFYKNNVEQTLTQTEFESIIGLNYDQFITTIYNPQSNSDKSSRFLSCSDSDKKSFLLRLLNLEKLELYKKNADSKMKELNAQVQEETQKLSTYNAKIEAYREALIDETGVNSKIEQLDSSISELNAKLIELGNVEKPDLDKLYRLEEDIRTKISSVNKAKAQRETLYEQYGALESIIIDENCSTCGSAIDEIEVLRHQEEKAKKLQTLKSKIDDLDATSSKESEFTDLLNKIKDKRKSSSLEYDRAREQMTEIKSIINKLSVDHNNLNLKLKNNSNYLNKINDLLKKSQELNDSIDIYRRQIEFYKTISNIYSPTGAQAYILDSIIDYFNESVQKYIEMLWPNVSYTLNSYKETAKGETTAKFSETLTMNGEQASIGSLSGGEYRALSLCVDFALLDVISNQFNIKMNPIILDEPFDGLDSSGREIVIALLDSLSKDRHILVVDHASESKVLFSKVITVQKKNGTSSIMVEV